MPYISKITDSVCFPETTSIAKKEMENPLFDITEEEIGKNASYCKVLINKILNLPYALLPDFFSYHCNLVSDQVKWLNKLEKLISENEELFASTTNRGRMMKCYTIIESKRKEIEFSGYKHTVANLPMQYVNAECEKRYFSFKQNQKQSGRITGLHSKNYFEYYNNQRRHQSLEDEIPGEVYHSPKRKEVA
ncbi:MAG TPA: hypothetical protein VNQ80_16660 [Parapedobacter sp.]|uniref:hypothetical protein n=1 Tax=Parapedobacter sp. TaxID=1958893 RepID=UPI002C964983|nr:hypothetical protein [Parapedobacter sp.]HWK58980.1 hypothetical protein [Parapedobacter sp.]